MNTVKFCVEVVIGYGKGKWRAMKEKKEKEMEEQAIEDESFIHFDAEVKRFNIICLIERSFLVYSLHGHNIVCNFLG